MYAADRIIRLIIKIPINPILNASVPIKNHIAKFIADDIKQTKNELPKVALEILPTFLANNHKINPPSAEPISKPKIIDVKIAPCIIKLF